MRTHLITGGAGFVGTNLARVLVARGDRVVMLDNLCRGRREHVESLGAQDRVALHVADLADEVACATAWQAVVATGPVDEVWHLAANSDIPAGVLDPMVDLRDTFMTTFNTLLMMKRHSVRVLRFASTSAVYGEQLESAFSERDATTPISNYGAMKLASESQIRVAVESFLSRADVFRFPNVVGVPATHGVIVDFVRKLKATPERLEVLGNGTQQKPYLHVSELVDAMLFITEHATDRFGVYNIGPEDDGVSVRSIAEKVRDHVRPAAEIAYGKEDRGWVGDVPRFSYRTDKLAKLGWRPTYGSADAIGRAVAEIAEQEAS